MFYPLQISNAYAYSVTRPHQAIAENSHLFVAERGNVLVDPLPFDDATLAQIAELGGVSTVVVLTGDRSSHAQAIAARFGAAVVDRAEHYDGIGAGLTAIRLRDQHRAHEFALHLTESQAVVAGETLAGAPAGALSMAADGKYTDVCKAALGLRRILRVNPERLLVSRGQSVYAGAYQQLYTLLYAKAGADVHRINVDELDFRDERDENTERAQQPQRYTCLDAEVGWAIGARGLGYRVSTLPPGHRFCPLHGHAREEELFYVIDGEPSVRMLSGTIRCRKGDFVALPVGESGTHQLLNDSDAPATVLLLARTEEFESCYYPDSDKLLVDLPAPLDGRSSVLVAAHPQLEYFHGES
ncbi:MAG: cupin domain-containing protein [Candidatus Eremiobacteraeota bacterium]|nr:cupin domain-containing protein [Candidatus Eremiobacteraeota bacterium]